jgi:phosphatidate phosphatase APP1
MRIPKSITVRASIVMMTLVSALAAADLKSDESVQLYPTWARLSAEGTHWELNLCGRVFELERRAITLTVLRKSLGLANVDFTPESAAIFNERARLFLADNERGKTVALQVLNHPFSSGKSGANGHFDARIRLPITEVGTPRSILVEADPGRGRPLATAEVFLLPATGLSVISDIDDTVKISEVTNKAALVRNTFLKPFAPVPGMAAVYRNWETNLGTQFHYVSASPWQLFAPLSEFVRSNGFPAGTFHLKDFRVKDRTFLSLFASPMEYKLGVIEPLLKQFPQRRFVLVGDSGELDPEIYGRLAKKYPTQIVRILIRDVTGESADAERYRAVFQGLPPSLWRVFSEPSEILGMPAIEGRE